MSVYFLWRRVTVTSLNFNPTLNRIVQEEECKQIANGALYSHLINIIMASKGQHFSETYSKKWKWITKSSLGSHYARCDTCRSDFNTKHGGANDIQKHQNTAKHKSQM